MATLTDAASATSGQIDDKDLKAAEQLAQVYGKITEELSRAIVGQNEVLKQVLIDSGVGDVFADALMATNLPPLVLAFLIAAAVRLVQGSATVAMLTAAGLVAALLGDVGFSEPMLALLVIAIAAGATIASHVNDSGFWLVNRYLGLSVPDTLRTWTVTTTIVALVSITLILIASPFVG